MLNFLYKWYNRDKMLSDNLAQLPPKKDYKKITKDCLFIGTKIRNLYDEERICIKETFLPERYSVEGLDYKLFGVVKDIPNECKTLLSKIKQNKIYDLIGYSMTLQDFNLTCNESFYNLRPPIYPIDNHHIKKYIDKFNYEDFICFNPEIPKFQAFSSLNLFFITVA